MKKWTWNKIGLGGPRQDSFNQSGRFKRKPFLWTLRFWSFTIYTMKKMASFLLFDSLDMESFHQNLMMIFFHSSRFFFRFILLNKSVMLFTVSKTILLDLSINVPLNVKAPCLFCPLFSWNFTILSVTDPISQMTWKNQLLLRSLKWGLKHEPHHSDSLIRIHVWLGIYFR